MNGITSRKLVLLVCMGVWVFSGQLLAEDGLYLGMDLGVAVAPGMVVTGASDDWGTKCDKIINPEEKEVGDDCLAPPPLSDWWNEVDRGVGILAGVTLGYRWGNLRPEGEYLYRITTYDDRSNTGVGDAVLVGKVDQELQVADGGVDDVLSHNFFANLYYDFTSDSRFTPYLGVGVGVAQVSLDYFSRWQRNGDPEAIKTFVDRELRDKLAGTTSIAMAKLSDRLPGYQVLGGVDYQVSDPFTMGLKFRWADFGEFSEHGREWDQLRSHDSTIGRGFRVRYNVMTDDVRFWGVSFVMKYQF